MEAQQIQHEILDQQANGLLPAAPMSRQRSVGTNANIPMCYLVVGSNNECNVRPLKNVQIFLSQNGGVPNSEKYEFLKVQGLNYDSFCDDFGPMNAISIIHFISVLDTQISNSKANAVQRIVYCAEVGPRALTNAAFLLGAYMILQLDWHSAQVAKCFEGLDPALLEAYRDASFAKPDFGLSLQDCWQGLERGKSKGWISRPTALSSSEWGMIDRDAYAHYDDPLNADLHEIIPKKLIAFRGPKDLDGRAFCNNYRQGDFVNRDFSPNYYADILSGLGVTAVVQLNETAYTAQAFIANGIEHHHLHADGSTTPPPHMVTRFFKIVDEAQGAVAVHGRGGLGCTGTLIALYMMRSHGFSAREAMAWIRIMRPGSIIGEQQHYLARIEQSIRRLVVSSAPVPLAPAALRAAADGVVEASSPKIPAQGNDCRPQGKR